MNSKRIVFLLLAVIVAGTTAFVARTWLQSERAAIEALGMTVVAGSTVMRSHGDKVRLARLTIENLLGFSNRPKR